MLEGLPWWAKRLDEMSGRFSRSGLGGLLDYHGATNTLGELLTQGIVTPEAVQAWLGEQVGKHQPATGSTAHPSATADLLTDPRAFWAQVWEEVLGRKLDIPPVLKISGKTKAAIVAYHLMPVYLPVITEEDYPTDFIKPQWGQHLTVSDIQRRPLPGRWVIVEMIVKPNWDDENGYGNGIDPLAQALGLTSRFSISWDTLHETHHPATANILGLSKKAVRLPTAEEWNLIGNLFLWLNANRNMNLPDLGATNSWEWAENTFGDDARLFVGYRGHGGLADVFCCWRGVRHGLIGFRVLAVL